MAQRTQGSSPAEAFPAPKTFVGAVEAHEVRHIREFSNFLVPRAGIFETESWGAAVAILASILPAVLTALSMLGMSLIIWLVMTFYMACPEPWARLLFLVLLTAVVFLVMELWWRANPTGEVREWRIFIKSIVALVLVGGLVWFGQLARFEASSWKNGYYYMGFWCWTEVQASYEKWWYLMGIVPPDGVATSSLVFMPRLYEPSMVWGLVALAFAACRFRGVFAAPSSERRVVQSTNDRTTMRLLGVATLWAVIASFWHIGVNLGRLDIHSPIIGIGAAGSASLFVLLRNWMGQKLVRLRKTTVWERIKAYVPQVLAYLTVGLAWAAVAGGLINLNQNVWLHWYCAAVLMMSVILLVLLVDPHEFGLHGAYRDRICRAYVGAANTPATTAAENRQTDFGLKDDITLSEMPPRPLHLVCCAANNVSGDHLATLSRGARSAVLSRYGVAVGKYSAGEPMLQLGSALTASAAAFNSNMGSVSMRVGPAVSFLMSALNLRLGLWVSHPRLSASSRHDRLLPGWLFYKEMIAWTNTQGNDLHLSDGAHFDNLGLYELVRRHCRYVIVSDCTADPQVAFDDFGNTARRIREDFDIEIEIDLEPLRPQPDGLSRQHMAVGTIHYDGVNGSDKGSLLYFKPTVTGEEPRDVLQYRARNHAFPHEATGDQFYDEAQWESYRRLGEHAANSALRFLQRGKDLQNIAPQKAFNLARNEWFPTPADLPANLLAVTEKYNELETLLLKEAPERFVREFFPELGVISGYATKPQLTTSKEAATTLHLLLIMLQLMEDAWVSCRLDTHWNHPLNLGWTNLFHRWTGATSFRMWWPLLKPLYGSRFIRFLDEQMGLSAEGNSTFAFQLSLVLPHGAEHLNWNTRHGAANFQEKCLAERGIAWQNWQKIHGYRFGGNQAVYAFELTLTTLTTARIFRSFELLQNAQTFK